MCWSSSFLCVSCDCVRVDDKSMWMRWCGCRWVGMGVMMELVDRAGSGARARCAEAASRARGGLVGEGEMGV